MAPPSPIRRDAIIDVLAAHGREMHVSELTKRLGLKAHQQPLVLDVLEELSHYGVVLPRQGRRFRLAAQAEQSRGRRIEGIVAANPKGFGFVNGTVSDESLFVPAEAMGGALHGDRVEARVVSRSSRGLEGEILRICERHNRRVVGVLRRRGASAWLEPDDERLRGPIVLPGPSATGARNGLAAVVRLTRYPDSADENPEAELVAVLGLPGEPEVEVQKILLQHEIDEEHPAAAMAEAEAQAQQVDPGEQEERVDLTEVPLLTIDPEDARDHDDAVWVERNDDGSYRAWIAVADVSHYVRPGTALDDAARRRATSVYLPDRAIPMLPPALSTGICSLSPDTLRLCMCAELDLRPTGTVRRYRFVEGVMRSRAKLSYAAVARALGFTTEGPRHAQAHALRDDLRVIWDLAVLLRQRRLRRGALDLDVPEVHIQLDEQSGAPLQVEQRGQDPGVRKAYRLIEELMLLANETCAKHLLRKDLPAIFRVHAAPDLDKLDRFAAMAHELGVPIDEAGLEELTADPKKLSKLLRRLSTHPQRQLLHGLLLRAMQQAGYDTTNIGHYGLASGAYLHFSSPIRRYPDLVVHRVLRAALRRQPLDAALLGIVPPAASEPAPRSGPTPEDDDEPEGVQAQMRSAALLASQRERNAMETERQVKDLYRALYMQEHIGDHFEATVSAVVSSGVFAQIQQPFVDVLIPMRALGADDYEMDELGLRAVAVRSGEHVELGDKVLLEVEDVSLVRRTVYGRRIVREPSRGEKRQHQRSSRKGRKDRRQAKPRGRSRGGRRR